MNAETLSMKYIVVFLILILLSTPVFAVAIEAVEKPYKCRQCGMDRTDFAQSRMLVAYADGSIAGTCSIHCVAAELNQNTGKPISSINVADYSTKSLLDARRATWVVGGRKKGVMTALAKWAFAREEDARKFSEENGGIVTSFDQAMILATTEVLDQAAEEQAVGNELLREMK